MYIRAIYGKHADAAELVAFSDVNPGRVEYYQKLIQELGAPGPVASFDPADLTAFIRRTASTASSSPPATTCTPSSSCASLDAGADVVVEKPLTIDGRERRRHRGRDRAHRPRGRHHVQLPLLAAQQRAAPGHPGRRDRRGHLDRLLSGCSTPSTARTTSAAGTARRRTPAACSSTRRATTSTSSTGGSAASPRRVFASGGLRFYGAENAAARGIRRAARPRHPRRRHDAVRARPARRRAPEGALPRRRAARRLRARPRRVRRGHHDRRQPRARRRLRHRARRSATRSTRTRPGRATASRSTAPRAASSSTSSSAAPSSTSEGLHPVLDPSAVDAGSSGTLRPEGERLLLQRHWEARVRGADRRRRRRPRRRRRAPALRRLRRPGRRPARPARRTGATACARSRSGSPATARSRPGCRCEVADLGIRFLERSRQAGAMSRIVVTGGAGRLGRSLVAGLAERRARGRLARPCGSRTLPSSRTSRRSRWTSPIRMPRPARIADAQADALIHLAAIAVPFSAPEDVILRTNAALALNVVLGGASAPASRRSSPRRARPCSATARRRAGCPTGCPLDEETPPKPWNAYALSKLLAEQIDRDARAPDRRRDRASPPSAPAT